MMQCNGQTDGQSHISSIYCALSMLRAVNITASLWCYDFVAYRTAKESKSNDSRDVVDEVHLSLVADAGQICIHLQTSRTSCSLDKHSRRRVEAALSATVVMPAVRT